MRSSQGFVAFGRTLAIGTASDNCGAARPGIVPSNPQELPLVRLTAIPYAQMNMGRGPMSERQTIDLGPLPDLIGYVLRRAQLAVFQDFFAAFEPFDIRPAQFSVLTIIERNPGLTQSHVAEALGIKRTNFVGMLDELEKRSLAERRRARDKRSYALYLTADGAALMRKLKPVLKAHEVRMIARVGEDGRDRLIALLTEIVDGRGRKLRNGKALRAPRAGSAET
jgi:DNA-binding MarR family transcriptional regulator